MTLGYKLSIRMYIKTSPIFRVHFSFFSVSSIIASGSWVYFVKINPIFSWHKPNFMNSVNLNVLTFLFVGFFSL